MNKLELLLEVIKLYVERFIGYSDSNAMHLDREFIQLVINKLIEQVR